MNFERNLKPNKLDVGSVEDLSENQESKENLNQAHEKIVSVLKVFKPEDISSDEFLDEVVDNLFEDAKKLQLSRGQLLETDEAVYSEMREILISRFKQISQDYYADYKDMKTEQSGRDLCRKARLGLILLDDLSDFEEEFTKRYNTPKNDDPRQLNFDNVVRYLNLDWQNPLKVNEIELLIQNGYLEKMCDFNGTLYGYIEGTPEELLNEMSKSGFAGSARWSDINHALGAVAGSEDQKYSRKAFENLIAGKYIRGIAENINAFENIDLEDLAMVGLDAKDFIKLILDRYGIDDPTIGDKLKDFVKHSQINFFDEELIVKKWLGLKLNKVLEQDSKFFDIRDVEHCKKVIEAGYLGLAIWDNKIFEEVVKNDYDWLLNIARENHQEHLLLRCPGIGNVLKKEDQLVYGKKLISEGKWYVLSSILGNIRYADSHFSSQTFDQDIYDSISSHDFHPHPGSFKNLNEETLEILSERFPDFIEQDPLSITSFEFGENSRLEGYKRYKEFMLEVEALFDIRLSKERLETMNFNFKRLSKLSLDQGLENIRRKASLYKKIESVAISQGHDKEQVFDTFGWMLNDSHSATPIREEVIDELKYVPKSLHETERCLTILNRLTGLDRDKKTRIAMELSMIAGSEFLGAEDVIYERYFRITLPEESRSPTKDEFPARESMVTQIPDFSTEYKEMSEHSQAVWQKLFPWSESLRELEGIQKHAKRREYDPWQTELVPLLKHELGNLSFANPEDGKILVEYVKRFGMKNIPYLYSVFSQVYKSKDVDQIPPHIKGILADDFGINAEELCKKDKKNLGLIFAEMEKMQTRLVSDIRNEDLSLLERVQKSPYLLETIKSIVGNSGHAHGVSTEEALELYRKAVKESPKKFLLPEGYEEVEVSVPQVIFEEEEKSEVIQKEKEKILSNSDLRTLAVGYRDVYKQNKDSDNTTDLSSKRDEIRSFIQSSIDDLNLRLKQEEEKEIKNEKAIFGLKSRMQALEEKKKDFDINFEKSLSKEISIKERMEILFDQIPENWPGKKNLMMDISLSDIKNKMPEGYDLFKSGIQNHDDEASISQIYEFIANHVKEHYLNKKHGQGEAVETDNKALIKALKQYWGVQDFDNSILAVSHVKLAELNKGSISENNLNLSFVPSKGLQRIFSGDLGRACTSRENGNLAKGEFEPITSYSIILDKGTKNERFAGSFLVIETGTEDGKPVMVLRANNPQQNLFNMVHGDSLVASIVSEVKALAKRRGIDRVVAPLSGGATSNRTEVAEYYDKTFSSGQKIGLKKSPETNFNGYDIWNKESVNAVTVI